MPVVGGNAYPCLIKSAYALDMFVLKIAYSWGYADC